jgi:hypothetical protein
MVRLSTGVRDLSFHHSMKTDSETHPAPYPMEVKDSFPWNKEVTAWYMNARLHDPIFNCPQETAEGRTSEVVAAVTSLKCTVLKFYNIV